MRRRDVLAASALTLAASPVLASDKKEEGAPTMAVSGVGLPVIQDGRVRNYVFLTLLIHLGEHADPEAVRARLPYFRDAIVRASHRRPFTVAGDPNSLNGPAVCAALMRAAGVLCPRGSITRFEITAQQPRRQVSVAA